MVVIKPTIVGLKHLFRRPVTVQYPFEKFRVGPNYRGVPAVNFDTCTSCERCVTVCPNRCTIMVEHKGKKVPNWYGARCMFCYLCIEVCPTGARTNVPLYELAEYTREATLWDPERLDAIIPDELRREAAPKTPVVDQEVCVNCLMCEKTCPWDAISHVDSGKMRTLTIDYDTCTYCGRCIDVCPPQALHYKQQKVAKGDRHQWIKFIPEKDIEVENYFQLLHKKVIEPHWCSHCTACVVACPVERILGGDQEISEDPEIPCLDCSLCVRSCPRYDYQNPKGLGEYMEVHSARSTRFKGQDGALATEFLVTAMEMGIIDAAIVVASDDKWRPYLKIARTPEEVLEGRRTKYALADVLTALKTAHKVAKKGIGIIGVPCQIEGFRRHAETTKFFTSKVKLVLGIFCTENFYYKRFYEEFIGETIGIKPEDLKYTDMKKGVLTIQSKKGEVHKVKLKEIEHYALLGCGICQHFANITADVSLGGSGSESGYSSVFIRRQNAKEIFDYMKEKGYIEFAPEEAIEQVMKTNTFMTKYKIKIHPIEPYLEDRGIKVEAKEEGEGG
ncbi:MAG: 4Fe-4S dicluster domain-containing protein [Methanobacteriota archaeon]|nr:MAG: 4Fe-4S dicluster domain-containing protein [Euryarchaeota archaeon]